MDSAEFAQKLKPFAKNGGGSVFAVAITPDSKRANYTFGHWAGFFSTEALRGAVTRPDPPFLLVCNHPHDRESDNQNVVEEIVRWEPDGTFVSTGVLYSKWGEHGGSEQFKQAAARLFKSSTQGELLKKAAAFAIGGGGNRGIAAVTAEPGRAGYTRQHWAGFFTSNEMPVTRPQPPVLLVRNGPIHMETRNQNVVEELVRWEADGSFVSTGVIFNRDDPQKHGSEAFRTAAAKLLKATP